MAAACGTLSSSPCGTHMAVDAAHGLCCSCTREHCRDEDAVHGCQTGTQQPLLHAAQVKLCPTGLSNPACRLPRRLAHRRLSEPFEALTLDLQARVDAVAAAADRQTHADSAPLPVWEQVRKPPRDRQTPGAGAQTASYCPCSVT
jgi:hypothetical protein